MGLLEFCLVLLLILWVLQAMGVVPAASGQLQHVLVIIIVVILVLFLIGSLRGGPILPYRVW